MMIGFPGAIFGIMAFFLREPVRTVNTAAIDPNYSRTDWKKLLTNKAFILLCVGYSIFGLATNSLSIWGATFFSRLHKYDLPTIGFWAGVLTLAAGIPATLFAGAIADWFKKGFGRMSFGMLLTLVSVPFWLILLFSDNVYLLLPASFVLLATGLGWVGAAAADVTEIAGINLRGLGIAIFFFCVNIAAYLIGSNLIGLLNDRFGATESPEMMRYALLVCPAACLISSVCLWRGSKMVR